MAGRRFVQLQRQVEQLQEELYRSETGKPFTSPSDYLVAFTPVRDVLEMFASSRGFLGSGYRMMSIKFYNDRPWLLWQRNLRQNWL